jgi:hypothetical protein
VGIGVWTRGRRRREARSAGRRGSRQHSASPCAVIGMRRTCAAQADGGGERRPDRERRKRASSACRGRERTSACRRRGVFEHAAKSIVGNRIRPPVHATVGARPAEMGKTATRWAAAVPRVARLRTISYGAGRTARLPSTAPDSHPVPRGSEGAPGACSGGGRRVGPDTWSPWHGCG